MKSKENQALSVKNHFLIPEYTQENVSLLDHSMN